MRSLPLSNVFNYIPAPVREDFNDDDQMLSWALQFARTVHSPSNMMHDWDIIEIKDHKGTLPDYRKINHIRFLSVPPSESDVDNIKQVLGVRPTSVGEETDPEEDPRYAKIHAGLAPKIYYQLFVNTEYVNREGRPVKFIGTTGKEYFSRDCYRSLRSCNNCTIEFSLSSDGCSIMTSEKEGWICMEYSSDITDADNNKMFPEEPVQFWQALGAHITGQYWYSRAMMKEQGAFQFYQQAKVEATMYMREAKAILRMMNIDWATQWGVTYGESNYMKLPAVFNKARTWGSHA